MGFSRRVFVLRAACLPSPQFAGRVIVSVRGRLYSLRSAILSFARSIPVSGADLCQNICTGLEARLSRLFPGFESAPMWRRRSRQWWTLITRDLTSLAARARALSSVLEVPDRHPHWPTVEAAVYDSAVGVHCWILTVWHHAIHIHCSCYAMLICTYMKLSDMMLHIRNTFSLLLGFYVYSRKNSNIHNQMCSYIWECLNRLQVVSGKHKD